MSLSNQLRWWSNPRYWLRALLMLEDTPHNIALGSAIGVFVALTPTVGFQMAIVLAIWILTRPLFRFNKLAALFAVYISNPLTMVPLYWFNYTVGTLYFPSTISKAEFAAIFKYHGLREWWSALTRLFVDVGVPLVVGSLVVAVVGSLLTYPLMLRLLKKLKYPRRQKRPRPAGGPVAQNAKQQPLRV